MFNKIYSSLTVTTPVLNNTFPIYKTSSETFGTTSFYNDIFSLPDGFVMVLFLGNNQVEFTDTKESFTVVTGRESASEHVTRLNGMLYDTEKTFTNEVVGRIFAEVSQELITDNISHHIRVWKDVVGLGMVINTADIERYIVYI